MLKKDEKLNLDRTMNKQIVDIAYLLNDGKVQLAFVKYETACDYLSNFDGYQAEFEKRLTGFLTLEYGYSNTQIGSFICSYCSYRKSGCEISTSNI